MYEDMDLPPDFLKIPESELDRIKLLPLEQRMVEYEKMAEKMRKNLSQSDAAIDKLWDDKLATDERSMTSVKTVFENLKSNLEKPSSPFSKRQP
jgi:hypothetical protein